MKVAIVHDDLLRRGGAERVALQFYRMFPDATIYTLAYHKENTYTEFKHARVKTSIFRVLAKSELLMKFLFFPLGYWSMRAMKISNYDLVILSTTYAAKYASYRNCKKVIVYCHNPFRLLWYPESYSFYGKLRGVQKSFFDSILKRFKKTDRKHAQRFAHYVANSSMVKERIEQCYEVKVDTIINPPVDLDNFDSKVERIDYYLVVSRLEPYKKVDLVIEAFNAINKPLRIVGNGTMKKKLKEMAHDNIEFYHGLSDEELRAQYASAKAFIFPQVEDFGITPLESLASGCPVIAYAKGGILETMHHTENPAESTVTYFHQQDAKSLIEAIAKFEMQERATTSLLRGQAEKFSAQYFERNMRAYLDSI